MKELLKLMEDYNLAHDTDICIRIYDDGSGIASRNHYAKISVDEENETSIAFAFDNLDQLKQNLQS